MRSGWFEMFDKVKHARWPIGAGIISVLIGSFLWFISPGATVLPLPEKLKAVQYFQADANLRTFWSNLDDAQLARDLDMIRSGGFNAIILMVPWGEFQPSIQPIRYDDRMLRRLHHVIQEAESRGLWVILRMGSHEILPEGVQGGDWWTGAVLTNEEEFAAYRGLFRVIANATRGYPRILYFWSWEDTYLWPQPWYGGLEDNRRAWREWCRSKNASLSFWNARWSEQNQTWEQLEIPDSRKYSGDNKVGDFWAFADSYIIQRAPELARALREGNPNGIIGFEARIDPDDTYHHLDTFRTITDYDFAASWYYPYQGVPLTHVAPLLEAREAVRELALQLQAVAEWGRRPVFFEQIGAALREENLDHQRLFLISATELLLTESLGYGIWAWQDYTLNSVYNPGFELGIDRWHAEGDVLDVDSSSHAFHGQRAVQLRPGGLIRQDMAGYGGRFCSLYARTEQLEKATLLVAIERLQDGRVTDRQERVLQIGPIYEQQVIEWESSSADANGARVTIRLPDDGPSSVVVDLVRCYSMISHLGICDVSGNPRQPLLDELTRVNARGGGSLAWRLRSRWWSLARRLGWMTTRVDTARQPGGQL